MHSLTNTFSGTAGEMRAAAEFVRCGLKTAKPYWNDDEIDMLVFIPEKSRLTPIPIQTKSVQFNPNKDGKLPDRRHIQGLKKRYVERQVALCLVLYRPDTDELWIVSSASAIKALYEEQYSEGIKQIAYADLDADSDVSIALDKTPTDNFNSKYRWRGKTREQDKDRHWLTQQLFDLAHEVDRQHGLERLYETVFFSTEEEESGTTFMHSTAGQQIPQ